MVCAHFKGTNLELLTMRSVLGHCNITTYHERECNGAITFKQFDASVMCNTQDAKSGC
jgi:hypothetical protein